MSSTLTEKPGHGSEPVYQEWLLMALIHTVQSDLKGHRLFKKESDFTKIMKELAKSLHSQLEGQAHLRVPCTLNVEEVGSSGDRLGSCAD